MLRSIPPRLFCLPAALPLLLLLLLLPAAAQAATASSTFPVFWVAGDPRQIANAFKGIAAFFGNGNMASSIMASAITAAALVGLVIALVSTVVQQKFTIGHWFVGITIAMMMFQPTTSVTVKSYFDETSATVSPRMIVIDHVPIGIAYPAGMASMATKTMSDKFITWFSVGSSGAEVNGAEGLMSPLKLLLRMQGLYERCGSNDTICANTQRFMRDCPVQKAYADALNRNDGIYTLLNDSTIKASTLRKEWNDVAGEMETSITSCNQSGMKIWLDMERYLTGTMMIEDLANKEVSLSEPTGTGDSNGMADPAKVALTTNLDKIMTEVQGAMNTSTITSQQIMAQMIFSRLVRASKQAADSGSDTQRAAIVFTETMFMARNKAAADATGTSSMFVSFMVSAMNMFSFLFVATAPIIILVAVVMGLAGFKIYGSWLVFGLWSQSWLPIANLISYYSMSSFWDRLQDAKYTNQLSMQNIDSFYEQILNVLYTSATMMSSVPVITLALISGSIYTMTSLAGKSTGTHRDYMDESKVTPDTSKAVNADEKLKQMNSAGNPVSSTAGANAMVGGGNTMNYATPAVMKSSPQVELSNTSQTSKESARQAQTQIAQSHSSIQAAQASAAYQEMKMIGDALASAAGETTGDGTGANSGATTGDAADRIRRMSAKLGISTPLGSLTPVETSADLRDSNKREKALTFARNALEQAGLTNSVNLASNEAWSSAQQRINSEQASLSRATSALESAKIATSSSESTGYKQNVSVADAVQPGFNKDYGGTMAAANDAAYKAALDMSGGDANKANALYGQYQQSMSRYGNSANDQDAAVKGFSSLVAPQSSSELKAMGTAALSGAARVGGQEQMADALLAASNGHEAAALLDTKGINRLESAVEKPISVGGTQALARESGTPMGASNPTMPSNPNGMPSMTPTQRAELDNVQNSAVATPQEKDTAAALSRFGMNLDDSRIQSVRDNSQHITTQNRSIHQDGASGHLNAHAHVKPMDEKGAANANTDQAEAVKIFGGKNAEQKVVAHQQAEKKELDSKSWN